MARHNQGCGMPWAWGGYAAPYFGSQAAPPYAGQNGCYAPLAACSQGVCIENGELLIAFVLLLIFFLGKDNSFPPGPPPWVSKEE